MTAVRGYCWPQSVVSGDGVSLRLSADAALSVPVRIVRDGLSPEVVWTGEVDISPQSMPEDAPEHGCGWAPTLEVVVGDDWRSGMYVVQLGEAF